MRIAFDATSLLFRQMGIASYVRHLLAALEQMNDGTEFVLLANGFGWRREDVAGLPASPGFRLRPVRIPSRLWRTLFLDWRLPADPLVGSADLLHVPDCIAPRLWRRPLVVTVHDMLDFVMPELFPGRLRDPFFAGHYRRRQRHVARSLAEADHVIAVSENTRADLASFLGLPEAKVSVIPYGLAEHFRPVPAGRERKSVLAGYGVEQDRFLLYVGRLEDRKNPQRMLQAMRLLLDQGVTLPRLVVCGWQGHPAETGDILAAIATLGLEGMVQRVDYVPPEHLPHFYSAAAALLYPSLYEGFGLPPLEAMACGTPVVAGRVSSVPEVVGDAALLVDPRDVQMLSEGIRRILEDPSLRASLRERGIERARGFSWTAVAERTMAVYHRLALH